MKIVQYTLIAVSQNVNFINSALLKSPELFFYSIKIAIIFRIFRKHSYA